MVHLPVNVFSDAGVMLAQEYHIGNSFPVFILTNGRGEIITRWTGYTGAQAFIKSLNKALKDLTTINEKVSRFEAAPNVNKAVKLANFFSDTGEFLEAVKYFRKAKELHPSRNYDVSYPIFTNTANAVWTEMAPFEIVYPAADDVLRYKKNKNIADMALIMSRLTRKYERTDSLGKYLEAGMDAAIAMNTKPMNERYNDLKAEELLQIKHDTTGAIDLKKSTLGQGWDQQPQQYYPFSEWCLERKINLVEAEKFASMAANRTNPGTHKARVYRTLAELCFLNGKNDEAVKYINVSITEHPGNPFYKEELERYEGE